MFRSSPSFQVPILVIGIAVVTACGEKAQEADLSFAAQSARSSLNGPLGRTLILNQGVPSNVEDPISICIENPRATELYDDRSALLETKLAYAMWFSQIADFSQDDWSMFEFLVTDRCDNSHGAIVSHMSEEQLSNDESARDKFTQPIVVCRREGNRKICKTKLKTGYGWRGSMSVFKADERWTRLNMNTPTYVRLTPYVRWINLEDELILQGYDELADRYRELRTARRQTWSRLASFAQDLIAASLVASRSVELDDVIGTITLSEEGEVKEVPFTPEKVSFATVLHEIGHQFGLDHADHPKEDSITGWSEGADQNLDGQWTTKRAAMAYGLPYLYLEKDDRNGIRFQFEKMKDLLNEQFGD